MSDSPLEKKFMTLWQEYWPELYLYQEYQVSKARRYRADFCCPQSRVVIEIQGGIWMPRSGHNSGSGITRDCEKACFYAMRGYLYFPLVSKMITRTNVIDIGKVIKFRLES